MNFDELCKRVRELATTGKDWNRVTSDESIGDAWETLFDTAEFDRQVIEAAFVEGRRVHRMANGWVIAWTDARCDYDQFDTEELECHEWHHRPLRKVLMNPSNAVYQRSRYSSGANVWDEDPREIERKIRETIDRENAEAEQRKLVREEGLSWLHTADLSQRTDEDLFDSELRSRGLTWSDLRREQKRRDDEQEAAERLTEWNRCRSMFADGCTIVDRGRDAQRYGKEIAHERSCNVYRNVRIVPRSDRPFDIKEARVEADGDWVGFLWFVAERLTEGQYRVADANERFPPAAVMKTLAPLRLDRVHRIETEGRTVYAMRERYDYSTIMVVDEKGRVVRKRSIKETAERVVRENEGLS